MLFKRFMFSPSCKIIKRLSSGAQLSILSNFKEQKIKVGNYEINYLRAGQGPHHVFCACGVMGTIWNDFRKQIEGFDHDKFSLVVWDPPGYGKSIVLDNSEKWDIFSSDADIAYEFMKELQIPRYSLLGWSNGGTVCLLLASRYPEVVNKVVAFGCSTFIHTNEIEYYKKMADLSTWSQSKKEKMIKLYGEENFKTKLNKMVDAMVGFYDGKKSFCDEVRRIKNPTLILHGAKDPVVESRHLNYLQNLVSNSRTYLYPEGKHNIHMKFADDFNKRVQEFLLEN